MTATQNSLRIDKNSGMDSGPVIDSESDSESQTMPISTAERDKLFQQMVNTHEKRLYRFILKNIGNPSDAEDLAQQAFVEAVRSFVTFRGESELSTWLYGIAMNLVRNYLSRSPHRLYQFESDEGLSEHVSDQQNPAEHLQSIQTMQRLHHELNELPKEMKDVLMLVGVDDLSYEEAATLLSVPIGTVRSRVARARNKLRARLENAGIKIEV